MDPFLLQPSLLCPPKLVPSLQTPISPRSQQKGQNCGHVCGYRTHLVKPKYCGILRKRCRSPFMFSNRTEKVTDKDNHLLKGASVRNKAFTGPVTTMASDWKQQHTAAHSSLTSAVGKNTDEQAPAPGNEGTVQRQSCNVSRCVTRTGWQVPHLFLLHPVIAEISTFPRVIPANRALTKQCLERSRISPWNSLESPVRASGPHQ